MQPSTSAPREARRVLAVSSAGVRTIWDDASVVARVVYPPPPPRACQHAPSTTTAHAASNTLAACWARHHAPRWNAVQVSALSVVQCSMCLPRAIDGAGCGALSSAICGGGRVSALPELHVQQVLTRSPAPRTWRRREMRRPRAPIEKRRRRAYLRAHHVVSAGVLVDAVGETRPPHDGRGRDGADAAVLRARSAAMGR